MARVTKGMDKALIAEGFYFVCGDAADIVYKGSASSGYSHLGNPRWYLPIEIFIKNNWVNICRHNEDTFWDFFKDPKLIAPINLITWNDGE